MFTLQCFRWPLGASSEAGGPKQGRVSLAGLCTDVKEPNRGLGDLTLFSGWDVTRAATPSSLPGLPGMQRPKFLSHSWEGESATRCCCWMLG